jgi:hypothetical protein
MSTGARCDKMSHVLRQLTALKNALLNGIIAPAWFLVASSLSGQKPRRRRSPKDSARSQNRVATLLIASPPVEQGLRCRFCRGARFVGAVF